MEAYNFLRRCWPFIGPVLGLYGLGKGFGITIEEALQFSQNYLLRANVIWLIVGATAIYVTITGLRHRGTPLTAIHTFIRVKYEDKKGRKVTVERRQELRANRDDVTGYIRQYWCDGGKIPENMIECTIDHCKPGDQRTQFDHGKNGLEVLHRFPAIPRGLLGLRTVTRTERVLYLDGFTKESESYEVNIPLRYKHHRLTVVIVFPPDRKCPMTACKAVRISAHGVTDLQLLHEDGGFQFEAKRIQGGERFRATWTLPPVA
jgi:hypothetical protein